MSTRPVRGPLFLAAFFASPVAISALGYTLEHASPNSIVGALGGEATGIAMLGFSSYVLLGLPLMWDTARRDGVHIIYLMAAGFIANLGSPLVLTLQDIVFGFSEIESESLWLALVLWALPGWTVGSIAAVIWGAGVGVIYRIGELMIRPR